MCWCISADACLYSEYPFCTTNRCREIERLRDSNLIADELEDQHTEILKVQNRLNSIYGGVNDKDDEHGDEV